MQEKRNKMIVEDYIAGRDMSEIRREYGLGERSIYLILKTAGVKKRDRKPADEKRPFSGIHERIGKRVYEHYFDEGMSRTEAANKLEMSTATLRNVEIGRHQLDLFDLQDLAAFLNTNVGELVDGG